MKAIVLHSIVPIRTAPSETAEQSTQLLFGETCTAEVAGERWYHIKADLDGQEGFADSKMLSPISDNQYARHTESITKSFARVALPMTYAVSCNNHATLPLTMGTRLSDYKNGTFRMLDVTFRIDANAVITVPYALNQDSLMQVTRFLINTPYLWGGKNALGMDCSGFTQVVMSLFGRDLPRNASQQALCGTQVNDFSYARAGDIAFFGHDDDTHISHVGILIDKDRIIHCSGRVKVEKLNNEGIFSAEQGKYTHQLRTIRRL